MTYEESQANALKIRAMVPEIARELEKLTKTGWKPEPDPPDAQIDYVPNLVASDGMRLHVRAEWGTGKPSLTVSGTIMHHVDGHDASDRRREPIPSATMSSAKTPAQLAKDIERRVITPYLPAFEGMRDRIQATADRYATARARAEQLAKDIGGTVSYWLNGRLDTNAPRACYTVDVEQDGIGSIEVSAESIRFQVSTKHVAVAAFVIRAAKPVLPIIEEGS